jgi:pilus assembly protein CpaE
VADDAFPQFLVRHASGLQVLAAPDVPEKAELVTAECVEQTIQRLRQYVDVLLVDTAYAFSEPLLAALDLSDLVCLVTAPHLAALRATADTMGVLERLGIPERRVMVALNRTTPGGFDTDQASAFLERTIDVVIPYNKDFDSAADHGLPLVTERPKESSAAALRDLASKTAAAVAAAAA